MKKQAFNPYLPSWEYIPDGEPYVFDDRVYVYGSHDRFNGCTFCLNDYVAIGWDDVPCKSEKERTEVLKEQLKATYGQPTRVLNQVYRFCEEMKAGDIVMIPSSGTSHLAFGRLLDDEIYSHVSSEEELEAKLNEISDEDLNKIMSELEGIENNSQESALQMPSFISSI